MLFVRIVLIVWNTNVSLVSFVNISQSAICVIYVVCIKTMCQWGGPGWPKWENFDFRRVNTPTGPSQATVYHLGDLPQANYSPKTAKMNFDVRKRSRR